MESSVVTSAAVVLSERWGSFAFAVMPRVLSQTYQSPVESVRLIRMKRAEEAKSALMTFPFDPSPVYEPTFEMPGLEANRYITNLILLAFIVLVFVGT